MINAVVKLATREGRLSGKITFQMIWKGEQPMDWAASMTPLSTSRREVSTSRATKEAEAIISKAEQQRRELIDQNSILQEARRRATEEISAAQQRSNLIRSSTQDYTDKMLSRVEELMVKDVNELRILRKTLSTGTELAKPQQPAQLPQGQPVPQKK